MGHPNNKIIEGPALRQTFHLHSKSKDVYEQKGLLILMSLVPEANIELVYDVSQIADWLFKRLKIPVLVKLHPMSSKSYIMKKLEWNDLPPSWSWFDGEISEALTHSRCAITLNTGAIIDVVISGTIPCPLTRALDTPWNYLDFLEDHYDILLPVEKGQLKQRLEEIFITNRDYYDSQTNLLKSYLVKGLNPVTNETMSKFLEAAA